MSDKHTVIIVEDEILARQRLKKLLLPYKDNLDIIGEAKNGEEGLQLIESLHPDFIFLDIQMPVMNGFDMILKLSKQPYIIFTTAFDEYAIKAFEENSIDYLLKPIRQERLDITIKKMDKEISSNRERIYIQDQLKTLLDQIKPIKQLRSITVKSGDKIQIVNVNDIAFFQAEDKLTVIYTTSGKRHLITQSLSQLDEKLADNFFRINRSAIINEDFIEEIRKGFNGKFVFQMKNNLNTKLTSGSTFSAIIKKKLKF